ncbi:MAG: MarR family transcriptional regulator [Flavobacteriales bacterium]|jgi:DNA-binding MarR family transcriptional regulator|nr:MarR family transcriptional regulator [Flavobacteriales bacterium]
MPVSNPSIGFWCSVAAQHYYLRLKAKLAHLDIPEWFIALVTIHEHNGKLSQQELADKLHLDKVTMTRTLDLMDRAGYIERFSCPHDRRKHLVRTTPKAGPAVRDIRKAYRELNKEALHGMAPGEREQFQQHLATMAENLRPVKGSTGSTHKRIKA